MNNELNSINYLFETLKKYGNYFATSLIVDNNEILCDCVIINTIIINSPYCDILTIDYTIGVDKLDYPVESIV